MRSRPWNAKWQTIEQHNYEFYKSEANRVTENNFKNMDPNLITNNDVIFFTLHIFFNQETISLNIYCSLFDTINCEGKRNKNADSIMTVVSMIVTCWRSDGIPNIHSKIKTKK